MARLLDFGFILQLMKIHGKRQNRVEILGQIRGKFNTVPIPGESVTLNHAELLSQAKAEQDALRDELKTTFDELTYVNLTTKDSEMSDNADKLLADIPAGIFVG